MISFSLCRTSIIVAAALMSSMAQCSIAFTIPSSCTTHMNIASSSASLSTPRKNNNDRIAKTLLFAEEAETATTTTNVQPPESNNNNQLFDAATMADATDALNSVGWSGVAPMQGDGEMTSDDPFVKQIDESIRGEMGVGLDELLNPAKVCLTSVR